MTSTPKRTPPSVSITVQYKLNSSVQVYDVRPHDTDHKRQNDGDRQHDPGHKQIYRQHSPGHSGQTDYDAESGILIIIPLMRVGSTMEINAIIIKGIHVK